MTQYYDDTAKDYAERAEAAAESASQSKQQASTAATTATTQASIATNAAQNAATLVKSELENDVRAMKDAALSAASQASANAAAASGSAVDASHDAIDADQSRQAAQAAQTAAETAQTAAETAMGNAASSAGAAAASAQAAATSESNAAGSASAAATSESNAATSESNAETSAQNAATSEENAEDSATLSKSWAVGGTGVRQDEDTNNAKHYAEMAEHYSPVSKADKVTGGDTDGMVAGLDSEGNLTNTGIQAGNVAQRDGYYAGDGLGAATAENLIDVYATPSQAEFSFRTTAGDVSIDAHGNAVLDPVSGGTEVVNQLVPATHDNTVTGTASVQITDAVQGDALGVTLIGDALVRNQIVPNGDFSDSTGWTVSNGTMSVAGGVCTVTGTPGESPELRGAVDKLTATRVYMVRFYMTASVTVGQTVSFVSGDGTPLSDSLSVTVEQGVRTLVSGKLTATGTDADCKLSIILDDGSSQQALTFDVEEVMVADLSLLFNNDTARMGAVSEWGDLVAVMGAYANYVQHDEGTVVPSNQTWDFDGTSLAPSAPLYAVSSSYYDSENLATGKRTTRIASVDLGTLTWSKGSDGISFATTVPRVIGWNNGIMCTRFAWQRSPWDWGASPSYPDNVIGLNASNYIFVKCTAYANYTVTEFKAAMSGVMAYYVRSSNVTTDVPSTAVPLQEGSNTLEQVSGDTGPGRLQLKYTGTKYTMTGLDKTFKYLYRVKEDGKWNDSIITGVTELAVDCTRNKLIDLSRWFRVGKEPSVATFFSRYPAWKNYDIPYIHGKIVNFKGTAIKSEFFNAYNHATGTAELLGGNQYQICGTYTSVSYVDVYGDTETLDIDADGLFTPAADGTLTVTGGNATNTCVHLTWSGYRNYGEPQYAFEEYGDNVRDIPVSTYFPGGMYGGVEKGTKRVFDELTSGKAVRRWAVHVFDGTETLGNLGDWGTGFTYALPDLVSTSYSLGYCNWWSTLEYPNNQGGVNLSNRNTACVYFAAGTARFIRAASSLGMSSVPPMKTYLAQRYAAGDPLIIVYQLATPVETPIDPPLNLSYTADDFGTEEILPRNTTDILTTRFNGFIRYNLDFTRLGVHLNEMYPQLLDFHENNDRYARTDGVYQQMTVGTSYNMLDRHASGTSRSFLYDTAGGTADLSAEGTAEVQEARGSTILLQNMVADDHQVTYRQGQGRVDLAYAYGGTIQPVLYGRTLAPNQLVPDTGEQQDITLWTDHKYYTNIDGVEEIQTGLSTLTVTPGVDKVTDLTQMFFPGREPDTPEAMRAMYASAGTGQYSKGSIVGLQHPVWETSWGESFDMSGMDVELHGDMYVTGEGTTPFSPVGFRGVCDKYDAYNGFVSRCMRKYTFTGIETTWSKVNDASYPNGYYYRFDTNSIGSCSAPGANNWPHMVCSNNDFCIAKQGGANQREHSMTTHAVRYLAVTSSKTLDEIKAELAGTTIVYLKDGIGTSESLPYPGTLPTAPAGDSYIEQTGGNMMLTIANMWYDASEYDIRLSNGVWYWFRRNGGEDQFLKYSDWTHYQHVVCGQDQLARLVNLGVSTNSLAAFYSTYPFVKTLSRLPYGAPIVNFAGGSMKSTGFNLLDVQAGQADISSWVTTDVPRKFEEGKAYVGFKSDNTINRSYAELLSAQTIANSLAYKSRDSYGIMFPMRCLGGTEYQYTGTRTNTNCKQEMVFYDIEGNRLSAITITTGSSTSGATVFTTPEDAYWMCALFSTTYTNLNTIVYATNACVHLTWSGYRNGDYENYWSESRDLQTTQYFPNGMNGFANASYDQMSGSGLIRRFNEYVFTGNESFAVLSFYGASLFSFNVSGMANNTAGYLLEGFDRGDSYPNLSIVYMTPTATIYNSDLRLFVPGVRTVAQMREYMRGRRLVYRRATDVAEDLDSPVNLSYRIADFGTEQLDPGNPTDALPTTTPFTGVIRYNQDMARTITTLPQDYQSQDSMDELNTQLGAAIGGTISKTWDATNGKYTYTFTPTSTVITLDAATAAHTLQTNMDYIHAPSTSGATYTLAVPANTTVDNEINVDVTQPTTGNIVFKQGTTTLTLQKAIVPAAGSRWRYLCLWSFGKWCVFPIEVR